MRFGKFCVKRPEKNLFRVKYYCEANNYTLIEINGGKYNGSRLTRYLETDFMDIIR